MAQKKKLQVFVSSTYTDLREERQAAVEAILTAGHIPAGMELFAAGDETQMNVIKRWIDESDVYMLILGGRYGSIEPKSQTSYIHLEYEYALEQNKPLFAVVINEKHLEKKLKKQGSLVIEKDHPDKLKGLRELVCSKMVRFWSDPKDIKLAILETMADFSSREELIGWIQGDEGINTGAVAEEIARLIRENSELRNQIQHLSSNSRSFNGLSFDEMCDALDSVEILKDDVIGFSLDSLLGFKDLFDKTYRSATLLHFFWVFSRIIREKKFNSRVSAKAFDKLHEFGLIEDRVESYYIGGQESQITNWVLSATGSQFLVRLRIERFSKIQEADKYIISYRY